MLESNSFLACSKLLSILILTFSTSFRCFFILSIVASSFLIAVALWVSLALFSIRFLMSTSSLSKPTLRSISNILADSRPPSGKLVSLYIRLTMPSSVYVILLLLFSSERAFALFTLDLMVSPTALAPLPTAPLTLPITPLEPPSSGVISVGAGGVLSIPVSVGAGGDDKYSYSFLSSSLTSLRILSYSSLPV